MIVMLSFQYHFKLYANMLSSAEMHLQSSKLLFMTVYGFLCISSISNNEYLNEMLNAILYSNFIIIMKSVSVDQIFYFIKVF